MAKPVLCVVGAGTAGLEGLLAAHELLGGEAELRLVAPNSEFRYRPMSPQLPFRPSRERGIPVEELAAAAEARWVQDRADVIDEQERVVITRDGDTIEFDFLLLAAGARYARTMRQGHVWQRGADPSFLDEILVGVAGGEIADVAVVVPRGARWPVPAYELALVLAWSCSREGAITLITAEAHPLAALGDSASDAVKGELDAAGVSVVCGTEVADAADGPTGGEPADIVLMPETPEEEGSALIGKPSDPARVRVTDGWTGDFARLVSLPTVLGPSISGVACDAAGFIETDTSLRVCASERIWAAGGCMAAALEHSALSTRQADAAITAIAARCGFIDDASIARPPDLVGVLLTGQREAWLAQNPLGTPQPSTRCLWWPPGRAVGARLARRLSALDPAVLPTLPDAPVAGRLVQVPIALGCSADASASRRGQYTVEDRLARQRDIENRQMMALRRRERDAEAEISDMDARLEDLADRQAKVIHELEQHGYLHEQRPRATPTR